MLESIPILNWFTAKFYVHMVIFIFIFILYKYFAKIRRNDSLKKQKYLTGEKVILITGGCMGIGKEMIKILVNEFNCKIINVDIRDDLFDSLDGMVNNKEKNSIVNYKCDLASFEQIDKVFEEIFSKHKKINILINNAAIAVNEFIYNLREKHIIKTINLNLTAPMLLTKKYLQEIENIPDDEFHVVNLGSSLSHITTRKSTPYISSKWGIYGMHDCMRLGRFILYFNFLHWFFINKFY